MSVPVFRASFQAEACYLEAVSGARMSSTREPRSGSGFTTHQARLADHAARRVCLAFAELHGFAGDALIPESKVGFW
jgi:hypothetical protein